MNILPGPVIRFRALLILVLLIGLICQPVVSAYAAPANGPIVLSGLGYRVTLSRTNGAILSVTQGGHADTLVRSGENGLWSARFRDGALVRAADFHPGGTRAFSYRVAAPGRRVDLAYHAPEITVNVTLEAEPRGVIVRGQTAVRRGVLLELALPARLRFDPRAVDRVVCPMDGNRSVGAAFQRPFFLAQPQDRPSGWQHESGSTAPYARLYGAPLDQRADADPPVGLKVTAAGREWLGTALADRVAGARAVVNRPPTRAQAELTLVDSPNGAYLSACSLGGQGKLWRVGGAVEDDERDLVASLVTAVITRIAAGAPAGRDRVGVIALRNGPETGGWAGVPVREWIDRLRAALPEGAPRLDVIDTVDGMLAALRSDRYAVLLNPYGEWVPAPGRGDATEAAEAVGRYVRAGGHWFEVGGYAFFYALRPVRYYRYGASYPPAFADFLHLDGRAGAVSVYRAQPRSWAPWAGRRDPRRIFVPGSLGCGADEAGGYLDRAFGAYVVRGARWIAPPVVLAVGGTAPGDLAAYCRANGLTRRLRDKMSPDVLARFKRSVLVYYGGTAKEKTAHLGHLPAPALVHFADYLHGGFDKQYPDHLPPNPSFGTAAELRAFLARSRAHGHLVMPYTNPTWWCDHPRGPTFARAGEGPLLKGLDGRPVYERYGPNDGYTVSHWAPAVQAANRRTVRQFAVENPVDLLFQDQCGARGWTYDTNPASPTPLAYTEGLLSMVDEDSRTRPLSTEGGWDQVANAEAQLCGMTWDLVPTEGAPSWRQLLRDQYPPEAWQVFPVAQYIAHDRASMLHHDLGQFVTNREVLAWTLGLGFGLSYTIAAPQLEQDAPREWLRWLDRLQKSVCARYVGEPLGGFTHRRFAGAAPADDGLITANYGPLKIAANLGPTPRLAEGRHLADHGFLATAPDLLAADLAGAGAPFVTEAQGRRTDLWVYAPEGERVRVRTPSPRRGPVMVAFDGVAPTHTQAAAGLLTVTVPARPHPERIAPPKAIAGLAPRDRPGAQPRIGVLDLGDGPTPNWTRIAPGEWQRAFEASPTLRQAGVTVQPIRSAEELVAALASGPSAWLTIVNPYGEGFPAEGPGRWREMLGRIRDYVRHGGTWWEVAGYTFYQAWYRTASGWSSEAVGPAGMAAFGLGVGPGAVDAPPAPLTVTPDGRSWLDASVAGKLAASRAISNRGLPRGADDPGHLTLLAGPDADYVGAYRLGGWGWFWRIGGFWPDPAVALPVVVGATEHLFTHPPAPAPRSETRYLWHATILNAAR